MSLISPRSVYVLWWREMKRFVRAKSRILGMLVIPFLFMAFLGLGFNNADIPGLPEGITYFEFLVPGIVGMSMLFASTFTGMSVLVDREFGFLKEIMVSPVSRFSIVLGRVFGGSTTSVIQGLLVLGVSVLIGFTLTGIIPFLGAVLMMILISINFISLGLILSTRMKDMQGFGLIMNLLIMPLFFLSGAIFPISNFPDWLQIVAYANPLTYGVDGLRAALIGFSIFPFWFDAFVIIGFSIAMLFVGSYLFQRTDSV